MPVGGARQKRKFRFHHPVLSLDSTVIPLCLSVFDWAAYTKTKGAVKLHTVLDNGSFLPCFAVMTNGKTPDIQVVRGLKFQPGTILVMDRGYEDHRSWERLSLGGVSFVTRIKDSTVYGVADRRPTPAGPILRDEVIELNQKKGMKGPLRLRRIEVWVEETQSTIAFLTNNFKLAASTIADIYRDRWQIGVSRQGHIVQSVKDRPRPKDSGLVAWEAP